MQRILLNLSPVDAVYNNDMTEGEKDLRLDDWPLRCLVVIARVCYLQYVVVATMGAVADGARRSE